MVLVGLIIGVAFRSVITPLVILAVAGLAYLVTIRVLGGTGRPGPGVTPG